MKEIIDNKLTVTLENGRPLNISVLDIVDSKEFNKSYIIYTIDGDNESIFSSILNESENSYSLETINTKEEMDYINSIIDKEVKEEGDML